MSDEKDKYNLAGIGMGHWAKRLYPSIKKIKKIRFFKALDVTSFEDKKPLLLKYNIPKERYFRIGPSDKIPSEFFDGADAVYIASHNQFHLSQVKQSLENGKIVIVEKTLATNRNDFNEIKDFIVKNGYENRVYPHLHYLSKALSKSILEILPKAVETYGKIRYCAATFFEETDEEDLRRAWLLRPENGGIFLDWIHPIEILVKFCGAEFLKCDEIERYIVNPVYSLVDSTGVSARFKLSGKLFSDNAFAIIRVGKGFLSGMTHKTLRLLFEKNAFLDFNFVSVEEERKTRLSGEWQLREIVNPVRGLLSKRVNKKNVLVKKDKPRGPHPYDVLVQDMVNIIEGENSPLSIKDVEKIYEPVWQFLEKSQRINPKRDEKSIQKFTKDGLEKSMSKQFRI